MFRQNGENHLKMSISPDSNPKIGASCSDMFTTCCSCHSISRQMSRNVEDTDQPRLQANVEKNVATCLPRASEHPEQPTAFGNAPAGVIHWRSTNAPCFEGMHGNKRPGLMPTDRPGCSLEHEDILYRFLTVLSRFVACYADYATENAKLLLPNDARVTFVETRNL